MTSSSLILQNMSFLSSSLSSSSLSLPNNFPIHTRPVQPTCLSIFYACILCAAILTNPVLMHKIEEMPLFIEDTISQELVYLFHDTTMAQNYHFLSAPLDLPAEYGVPLRLTLARIPEHTLSLLHLHGFHTFVTHISPTLIYPTFHCIFFTVSMGERDHYITQAELLHPHPDSPPLMIPPPSSSVNTSITELRAQISSPPLSQILETPMAVESTISSDRIDTDARTLIQSYNITLPLGQHILSSPTCVLPDVILINLPTPSPSVFVATIWATTERTVPPTTAHTAMSPRLGTLNVYVCPPSVVLARIGDTPTDSALVDIVIVAIPSDMCLLIVWLKTLPWNRQHPSLQEDRFNHGIISLL